MVLLATLFGSAIALSTIPNHYTKPVQLFSALVSLTAAILTGFYQAKRYPKARASGTPH